MCDSSNITRDILLSLLEDDDFEDKPIPVKEDVEKLLGLSVSDDRMEVRIRMELGPNCKPFELEEILRLLKNKKIIFGIKKEKIQKLIDSINRNFIPVKDELIVAGKRPILGHDAKIIYHFELKSKKIKPVEDEEGKVNFKELDLINNVSEGDLLAEKIQAVEHQPGIDVYGEAVVPEQVRDYNFATGTNVKMSEDGLKAYSEIDGQVVLDKKLIKVHPVYVVRSDVCLDSGNVQFNGTVYIMGDVRSGFSVKAKKDVIINGSVEAAEITAGGSVRIRHGFVGQDRGLIKAKEDVQVRYVEKGKIIAFGEVRVQTSILNSKVTCYSNVNMPLGQIIGGETIAVQGMEVKNLGSRLGVPTKVTLGDKPVIRERLTQINDDIVEKKKLLEKILTIQKMKAEELEELLEEMEKETREKLQITLSRKEEIEQELLKAETTKEKLEILFKLKTDSKLILRGKVHPNTTIVIGHSSLQTKENYSFCEFYEDNFDRKVRTSPIS